MRKKNGFSYSKDVWYFTITASPRNITMHRKDKTKAMHAFEHYKSSGKKIEWLGKWDGKKFIESEVEAVA